MNKTQQQLVIDYCKENGEITPAKLVNTFWKGEHFGTELGKRCRELRARGTLLSRHEGRYEVFRLKPPLRYEVYKADGEVVARVPIYV